MLPHRLTDVDGLKLLVTVDAIGGIWTYAVDLARGLAERGAAMTLAVLGPAPDAAQRRRADDAGLDVIDLGHRPEWLALDAEEVARAGEALGDLARHRGVDLVHLNHPALAASAHFDVPVLAVCHSCVATWWAAVEGTPLPDAFAWQADLVGRGYRAADALVAPSQAFAEATRSTYGLMRAPHVVPNGRAAAAVDTRAGDPVPFALTLGRLWDAGKGVATLDRAAPLTRLPIRAAGPTHGPNGAVIALRHLDLVGALAEAEVRMLLAGRPVFVSAARYEPFGLAVLEAAQAGCALVLSDIPTFREVWDEVAFFVAPEDAAGFAAALDRLAGDAALRARFGKAARHRAERYGLAAQTARMAGLYASLLHPAATGGQAA